MAVNITKTVLPSGVHDVSAKAAEAFAALAASMNNPVVYEVHALGQAQMQVDPGSKSGDQTAVQVFMAKSVNAEVHQLDQTTAYVEELVNLYLKLKELGAYELIDRVDELKKLVQSSAQPTPDDQELILKSPSGTVVFSAVSKKTEISDKPKAISFLGSEQWLALSQVSITDLKKYLSESQLAECTKKGKGSRSMKSVVPA
jgi:hypothetical protein